MTTNEAKHLIRGMIHLGIPKAEAFGLVQQTIENSSNEKQAALERFHYELNAEEQRRNDGNSAERP